MKIWSDVIQTVWVWSWIFKTVLEAESKTTKFRKNIGC